MPIGTQQVYDYVEDGRFTECNFWIPITEYPYLYYWVNVSNIDGFAWISGWEY
jgi:hypothetical protein